jgi:hypothetical protein
MSELITDEMVEAAADAIADAYDALTQDDIRSMAQIEARAALEAAAPLIAGRALRGAAERLHERTDGVHREGTKGWPERHREVYALAINEASDALKADADRIEGERGEA